MFCKKFFCTTGTHMCPVKTYDLYVSRLDPRLNRLWQVPRDTVTWEDQLWYSCQPVGKTKCQDLMPTLYINAGLSKRYTNHCVRSTVMGILDRGKFGARKIMRWSGHKSETSIKSYAHTTSDEEKKEMANFLNNAAMRKENKPPKSDEGKVVPATVSKAVVDVQNEPKSSEMDLSLQDLLELTPEQEKKLLKDLFTTEMDIPQGPSIPQNPSNSVVQSVNNVAKPVTTSVAPKMMFANSSVTINFNINKN